jgi:hypothetical protein
MKQRRYKDLSSSTCLFLFGNIFRPAPVCNSIFWQNKFESIWVNCVDNTYSAHSLVLYMQVYELKPRGVALRLTLLSGESCDYFVLPTRTKTY